MICAMQRMHKKTELREQDQVETEEEGVRSYGRFRWPAALECGKFVQNRTNAMFDSRADSCYGWKRFQGGHIGPNA